MNKDGENFYRQEVIKGMVRVGRTTFYIAHSRVKLINKECGMGTNTDFIPIEIRIFQGPEIGKQSDQ